MAVSLDACLKVIENISREEDPDRFVQTVLSETVQCLNADYGVWIQRLKESGTLRPLREFSPQGAFPRLKGQVDSDRTGFPGQVIEKKTVLVLSDYQNSPRALPPLVTYGIRTVMGIPVRLEGGEVAGLLLLGFLDGDRAVDPAEIKFHEFLADHIGSLLSSKSLLKELRDTQNELQSVSRLYKALTSINALILKRPEEAELLSETIRILIELGGFVATGFYFPDSQKRTLELRTYQIIDHAQDIRRYPLTFSLEEGSLDLKTSVAVKCFVTQTQVIVNDLQKLYGETGATKRLEDYRVLSFRSTAVFPLMRGGHCTGVFAFVSTEKDFFTSGIASLLSEAARILSMSLDNIDLERERQESEERLSTLIKHLPEAIFFKDGEGRWKTVNPAALQLFHMEGKTDWAGKTDQALSAENPGVKESYLASSESDERAWLLARPVTETEIFPGPDGSVLTLEISKIPLFNPDGSRKGLVITGQNITQRKKDEEIRERYARIFENSTEGIMITGADRQILEVNRAFTQITEYDREEVLGKDPRILASGLQKDDFYRAMWQTINAEDHWEGEIWNRKKSGSIYCEWLSISVLRDKGQVTHYIGIFSDISDRKTSALRIEYLASHDTLTDLPNRRIFKEKVDLALDRMSRTGESFAVGILDLDGFKSVNDRLGHPAGDELLVQVGNRLKNTMRKLDTLARLGGDEFGILFSSLDHDSIQSAAEKIMKIFNRPFALNRSKEDSVKISGSLGLTLCPPDRGPFESLLAHADMALYRMKERGRNGWTLFEQDMEDSLMEQHRIRQEFARAIKNGELTLHYQPQANMKTGKIEGVEALVRWNHPERGLLHPLSFIDVIEKSDLIHPLGRWVLSAALDQQAKWRQNGLPLKISVNIGAKHFLSHEFITSLRMNLSGLPPADRPGDKTGLCLEITETEALHDLKKARHVIDQCRSLNVHVSLDDFGTGQASIKVLQELNIDEVKIDRGFVRKIMKSPRNLAIVSSLITAARMLLINVVAEGVESEKEGEILIHMGCPVGQGSAVSLPMPSDEIPGWIAAWTPSSSWRNGFPHEMLRTEDISYLMIDHSTRESLKNLRADLDKPELSAEKWTDRKLCAPCQWIAYAARLKNGRMEEGFKIAAELHETFHSLLDEAFSARLKEDQTTFLKIRDRLTQKGEALEGAFQKLLKTPDR